MSKFREVKSEIQWYCWKWQIPQPKIIPAYKEDPCDTTDPPMIRIKGVRGLSPKIHAKHVIGHYLADLHLSDADYVADKIAEML